MIKKNYKLILFNIGMLLLGVFLVLWADKVTKLVSILLGLLIILYGGLNIVNYFKVKEKETRDNIHFIYGIFILIIGFVLIFRVDFIKELISFVVGIYIILASCIKLHNYFVLKKNNDTKLTSSLVLSIIGIVIGILCLVGKFFIPDVVLMLVGYVLIIYSLIDIINIIILGKTKLLEAKNE